MTFTFLPIHPAEIHIYQHYLTSNSCRQVLTQTHMIPPLPLEEAFTIHVQSWSLLLTSSCACMYAYILRMEWFDYRGCGKIEIVPIIKKIILSSSPLTLELSAPWPCSWCVHKNVSKWYTRLSKECKPCVFSSFKERSYCKPLQLSAAVVTDLKTVTRLLRELCTRSCAAGVGDLAAVLHPSRYSRELNHPQFRIFSRDLPCPSACRLPLETNRKLTSPG